MKCLFITDIHGNIDGLFKIADQLKSADYILLGGDITSFGKTEDAEKIIHTIKMFNQNIMSVAGNCDYRDVEQYLAEENISLNKRYKIVDSYIFAGIGGSLTTPTNTPEEYTEKEYSIALNKIFINFEFRNNDKQLVFISHQPPYGTVNDLLINGIHVGSKSVSKFIKKYSPSICLTGHIHEGRGIDIINNTKILNPGTFQNGYYACVDFKADNSAIIVKLLNYND
ncbi:MAG: YfcE family phosphodiesterase [bacterium]|nr:YfcE family phosphodiesterase [bacterium]